MLKSCQQETIIILKIIKMLGSGFEKEKNALKNVKWNKTL